MIRHWGKIATAKYPDLAVTRCHSYSIQFKHVYKCTNIDCGMEIGRHSKSIDTSTKVWVLIMVWCRGMYVYSGTVTGVRSMWKHIEFVGTHES
jgi:hypothetical protein